MKTICLLKNTVQEYAWGSYTAIPELLGKDSPSNRPQAELWMGAHPKAPSKVNCEGKWISLIELIKNNPIDILGKEVANKYDNRLPYLLKVLAAAKPLSIQAHPSLKQASAGFERENSLGIPLNAFNRNYKDNNHKPECICALTPFWALNGFRKISGILSLMEKICPQNFNKELADLRNQPDHVGLKRFFNDLMTMDSDRQKLLINDAVRNAQKLSEYNKVFEWMVNLHNEYQEDIGIFSPVILNLICLEPGQAMFLPAGEFHAYLDGVGIELMANSDNVLRGGLTPKHVDVPELLKVLNFEEREINILSAQKRSNYEYVYLTPADEFELSVITDDKSIDYTSSEKRGVEIILCIDGEAIINDIVKNVSVVLVKGASAVIPASVKKYGIKGEGTLYKASVPV
ncbi:MAG: mannose-6-phosphate isomerase, class I [Deltaproteobacteria bacterium]|nr:mannose-6-phosphate isomerase, class I [Deltaproteobacteria bacterium]